MLPLPRPGAGTHDRVGCPSGAAGAVLNVYAQRRCYRAARESTTRKSSGAGSAGAAALRAKQQRRAESGRTASGDQVKGSGHSGTASVPQSNGCLKTRKVARSNPVPPALPTFCGSVVVECRGERYPHDLKTPGQALDLVRIVIDEAGARRTPAAGHDASLHVCAGRRGDDDRAVASTRSVQSRPRSTLRRMRSSSTVRLR